MGKTSTILVVDDESGIRTALNTLLKDEYNVLLAGSGDEAIEALAKNPADLVLLDIKLPDIHGVDLLAKLKEMDPNIEVIMVTAVREIETAVKAIKSGAYEYVIKPFNVDEIMPLISRALEKRSLVKEVVYLRTELERYLPFEEMIGTDKKMQDIFELLATVADSDGSVLIYGESGTGKELAARAIHNRSPRKNHPFVAINCAAIPKTLMESEVFGYYKGAFTGATQTTVGKLEIANNGTVFLDDIDNFDVGMQAKLLRVIQEKEFERLGGTKVHKVDTRFVAACNKNIKELISKGEFREDLYYRLNVFPITLPPLRERKADIPLLLDHFLMLLSKRTGKAPKKFSDKLISLLMESDWPGNIRELQNMVERLFTVAKGDVIDVKDISVFNIGEDRIRHIDSTLKEAVSSFEKQYISDALKQVDGSRKKASDILGIHRNTLLGKINGLGLK
ncbi:MAG: sigma-54-dependent Fis family transcriptional regulator [Desulfobacterales bacterium]|nr:sigma-54-dependent Fis family transcriptional regulator [Desulfobacterales bacterium]